jgi:hypothetical protein
MVSEEILFKEIVDDVHRTTNDDGRQMEGITIAQF